ncbi:MAG TPA: permease prefix domain 1-containing protein [Thermomicrobiales bacterium]|jgi:hypothetical protein
MDNPQVTAYLDTVRQQLGSLSADRRDEEMREIRQHLELLIAAQRAQGFGEDAAAATALRQFGHAEQIGRQLQRAEMNARQPRLWPLLLFYACSVVLIFGLLATANDKPTDFPASLAGQLVLALVLPAGMLVIRVVAYLRTRRRNAQG